MKIVIKDHGPEFRGSNHAWPGLQAANRYGWQEGLRIGAETIGNFHFQISERTNSGYEDWDKVAGTAVYWILKARAGEFTNPEVHVYVVRLADGRLALLLIGHSNGVFAITSIAEAVKPYGIPVYIVAFDQTLKRCPALGANVIEAVDIHAQLTQLARGPDFAGQLHRYDFSHRGHIGVIGDQSAQAIVIKHMKKWTGQA